MSAAFAFLAIIACLYLLTLWLVAKWTTPGDMDE